MRIGLQGAKVNDLFLIKTLAQTFSMEVQCSRLKFDSNCVKKSKELIYLTFLFRKTKNNTNFPVNLSQFVQGKKKKERELCGYPARRVVR